MRALVYRYGFVDFNEILDRNIRFSYNTAYNYAVLCYCVIYPIVAVEAIMTLFIFKFLGGNPSFPHLRMKPFRSLAPRNINGLICETC